MSSIYLTGDVIENPDFQSLSPEPDWRTMAMSKLHRYGMKVVNPIVGAWAGTGDILDRRVRRALDLIDQCDAMLANLRIGQQPGYGTAMEIFYAHRRGKMVTVVGQNPFSPWVLSHSQARFLDIDQALDFLIEEQPQPDMLAWSLQQEALLSERYEMLPVSGELDYQFFGGELPILIVAPHATAYFVEGEFHEPDTFTGSLAACVHRISGCHSILSNYCSVADPMLHRETPMSRAIADIVKAGQIGLVIILLGSLWHESPGISVVAEGPDGGIQEDFASLLRLKLSVLEPVSTVNSDLTQNPMVSFFTEVLSLPCLVMRTHRRYRMPKLQPEPFMQVASLMSEFLTETGLELLRNRS